MLITDLAVNAAPRTLSRYQAGTIMDMEMTMSKNERDYNGSNSLWLLRHENGTYMGLVNSRMFRVIKYPGTIVAQRDNRPPVRFETMEDMLEAMDEAATVAKIGNFLGFQF